MSNKHSCIIAVDMVNDFVGGKFGGSDREELAARMRNFLLETGNRIQTVFTLDTHIRNDPEFKVWGEHCLEGEWGSMLCDDLKDIPGYRIRKRHYDAFHDTDLDGYLRAIGADSLYIMGISTDICVLHTVSGAFHRYFSINLVEDMCLAIDRIRHREAIGFMQRNYGIRILNSADVLKEVKA